MNPERWKRVEAFFERSLETPDAERLRFLEGIADAEIRQEVGALLQAHSVSGPFLEERDQFFSGESFDTDSLWVGQVIDRYRILREIGRGGMGAVFLAERADDEYRKQVAIKLIKRGADTDAVLRHFRNERQILAGFDHPNIARLLDGGTTENGLPYFVMEYIEGVPLDVYCNARAASITERLKLFREACGAVSYAHRHLVIHRDIKRSNILVTSEGIPKLLDFGIAKILQEGDEAAAPLTLTGGRLMTPGYASPEQIRGETVTTATDVYSLGVVLYELLTGQSPYGLADPTSGDFSRAVNEVRPVRPSAAVRTDEPPGLLLRSGKLLRGDIDNIVLMALRKEPGRRYQSVEQFSEDIRRHLAGLPVLARTDTLGYRTGKFVRRNKAALAAAAVVFLILVAAVIVTSHQAQIARREKARAERRFNDVRDLANNVLFDYHDAIKDLPGATKVRERLVRDARTYLDRLAVEAKGEPDLQRELAAAYRRVGDARVTLGDATGARESYLKSLEICEFLVSADPADGKARRELASVHSKIGEQLLRTAEASRGFDHLQQALRLYLATAHEEPANSDLQLDLACVRVSLGRELSVRGDFAGALAQHSAALNVCEQLASRDPRNLKARHVLWIIRDAMADLRSGENDLPGAIAENKKALALGESLIADDPVNVDYRRALVLSYRSAGRFLHRTDQAGEIEFLRRAESLDEELLTTDPANSTTRRDLASLHKYVADCLANTRDYSQALLYFTKAQKGYEKVAGDSPGDVVPRFSLAACHAGAAGMEARLGELAGAVEECRQAMNILREISEDPANARQRKNRAQVYEYIAYAHVALAESPKAEAEEKRQWMTRARDLFGQALGILDELRTLGRLSGDVDWAKEIAAEVAKCDKALEK